MHTIGNTRSLKWKHPMQTGLAMAVALLSLWLLVAGPAHAAGQNDLSGLHPTLQQLYRQLVAGETLAGRQYAVDVRLKAATDKIILLEDGYVKTGDGLKYAFLTFERGYQLPAGLQGGQKVRLVFRVIEERNDATTPGMPYLVVRLIGLEPRN